MEYVVNVLWQVETEWNRATSVTIGLHRPTPNITTVSMTAQVNRIIVPLYCEFLQRSAVFADRNY